MQKIKLNKDFSIIKLSGFLFFILFFSNNVFGIEPKLDFSISSSSNFYELNDDDLIFLNINNNSRLSLQVKHFNYFDGKKKLCKTFDDYDHSDYFFEGIKLSNLKECKKNAVLNILEIRIKGIEDNSLDFKIVSYFNRKKINLKTTFDIKNNDVKNNFQKAIVIPDTNFLLYFYKMNINLFLDHLKKDILTRNLSDYNFNYQSIRKDMTFDSKVLPSFITSENYEQPYMMNFYKHVNRTFKLMNSFGEFKIISDYDLNENLHLFNKIVFPYHQEHVDKKLYHSIMKRLNDDRLEKLDIISLGANFLHKISISDNKNTIKYSKESYNLFRFKKNYCFEGESYKLTVKQTVPVCNKKYNSINDLGEYVKIDNKNFDDGYKKIKYERLFKIDLEYDDLYHIYKISYPNGTIIQASNDLISMNFNKHKDIMKKIELTINN